MRRIIVLLIVLAVLPIVARAGSGGKRKTDWEISQLYGKVKSFRENCYKCEWEDGQWKPMGTVPDTESFVVRFNRRGKSTYFEKILHQGVMISKWRKKVVEYDENGKVVESYVQKQDDPSFERYLIYDGDGNEIGFREVSKIDDVITRVVNVNHRDRESRKTIYSYDDQGRIAKQTYTRYPQSAWSWAYVERIFEYHTFDAQGNWTQGLHVIKYYQNQHDPLPREVVLFRERIYEYY